MVNAIKTNNPNNALIPLNATSESSPFGDFFVRSVGSVGKEVTVAEFTQTTKKKLKNLTKLACACCDALSTMRITLPALLHHNTAVHLSVKRTTPRHSELTVRYVKELLSDRIDSTLSVHVTHKVVEKKRQLRKR